MKVSICIASHNQGKYLPEAIESCLNQHYPDTEIIVLDDGSTDGTKDLDIVKISRVKYFRSEQPSGSGEAFNKAISYATGEVVVLLCADDLFTDMRVIGDIVGIFENFPNASHVSRFYHQFIDGDRSPVRAWRCKDIIELANNPSGLAFRASMLQGHKLTNKMFVEAPTLVREVTLRNPWSVILDYDTVAVRIHNSTARSKEYYLKRWVSSPVEEWVKVGGKAILKDFTSLIQIKNYFTTDAVIKECKNFIRLKPSNLINPAFIFFALVSILTPRFILRHVPHIYRRTIGKWTTKKVKRP